MKKQSKRSRFHEYAGEERHLHGYKESHGGSMDPEHYKKEKRGSERMGYRRDMMEGREYPVGTDPRRTHEMEDAGMIREDMSAIANLPQGVMMKPYAKTGPYLPEVLDDTIAGVDRQMDYDDSKRRMNFYPKKV